VFTCPKWILPFLLLLLWFGVVTQVMTEQWNGFMSLSCTWEVSRYLLRVVHSCSIWEDHTVQSSVLSYNPCTHERGVHGAILQWFGCFFGISSYKAQKGVYRWQGPCLVAPVPFCNCSRSESESVNLKTCDKKERRPGQPLGPPGNLKCYKEHGCEAGQAHLKLQ
jgi:hypothetical protein